MRADQIPVDIEVEDFKKQVEEVLVKDLGHKLSEAQRLVKAGDAEKSKYLDPGRIV